jgi:hypothetical protein
MIYKMIYGSLSKGEDGLYHVKALTEEQKRCYVQVKNVKVVDDVSGEVTFDLTDAVGVDKIDAIHAQNLASAFENSETWFAKKLTEKTINKVYTKEDTISADKIPATKVFDAAKQVIQVEAFSPGTVCTIMLEYAGLWFAKKAFGPAWNLVQVKLNPEPEPEPEPVPEPEPESAPEPELEVEAYPEEFVIEDDE